MKRSIFAGLFLAVASVLFATNADAQMHHHHHMMHHHHTMHHRHHHM